MKKQIIILATVLCALAACTDTDKKTGGQSSTTTTTTVRPHMLEAGKDTSFISTDTANKMLTSYLASINASGTDSDVKSLIIDANALRDYLTSDSGTKISHMKIMFAHRLNYINSGHQGVNCGYNINGLTVILAGYDDAGNYVYYPTNRVDDNGLPCPHSCPTVGTAAHDKFEN